MGNSKSELLTKFNPSSTKDVLGLSNLMYLDNNNRVFKDENLVVCLRKIINHLKNLHENQYGEENTRQLLRVLINLTSNISQNSQVIPEFIKLESHQTLGKMFVYYMKIDDGVYANRQECMGKIYAILINLLFKSESIARENAQHDFITYALECLRTQNFLGDGRVDNEQSFGLYDATIGFLLHNSFKTIIKQDMIDANVVQILCEHKVHLEEALKQGKRTNELQIVNAYVATILVFIARNEEELEGLEEGQKIISTLLDLLNEIVKASNTNQKLRNTKFYLEYVINRTKTFVSATDILKTLTKITINDNLKHKLVALNGLKPILTIFNESKNDVEEAWSSQLLAVLCTNNVVREYIKSDNNNLKLIEQKSKHSKFEATVQSCKTLLTLLK